MTDYAVAYGGALYELCREEGVEREVCDQLRAAARLFEENPDYTRLLGLASVPKEERLRALDGAFSGRVHPYLLNFMKIITERGAIASISDACRVYFGRLDEDMGILPVSVVSARPLTAEESQRLKAKLDKMTGKSARLEERVDPELLGGLRVTMDGRLYDGTVRARLKEIERTLLDQVI